jgi:hypothetical protein
MKSLVNFPPFLWADARELCFISKKIIFDIDLEVYVSRSLPIGWERAFKWSNTCQDNSFFFLFSEECWNDLLSCIVDFSLSLFKRDFIGKEKCFYLSSFILVLHKCHSIISFNEIERRLISFFPLSLSRLYRENFWLKVKVV